MSSASTGPRYVTSDVSPADPWDLFKEALGVATQQEVADRAGLDLRTAQRMFAQPERLLRHAFKLRAVTGVGLDQMFPPPPAATMSEAA